MRASLVCKACLAVCGTLAASSPRLTLATTQTHHVTLLVLTKHQLQPHLARLTVSSRPHELVQHRSHLRLGRHVCRRESVLASRGPHTRSLLNCRPRPRLLRRHRGQLFPTRRKSPSPSGSASWSCASPVQFTGYSDT